MNLLRPDVKLRALLLAISVSIHASFLHGDDPVGAKKLTDKDLERAVEALFLRETDYDTETLLKQAGRRATPYFVKALEDTKRVTPRFGKEGEFVFPPSPLHRISNLLTRDHLPEVVAPLTKLTLLDDEDARKCAGLALGVLSSEDCIEPVRRLLKDPDEYVVSASLIGMKRALEAEQFDRGFMSEIFPDLRALVLVKESKGHRLIPEVMLKMDREKAIKVLVSTDVLSVENRQCHYVLQELNKAEVAVDHKLLLPYLEAVKPLATKYPHTDGYSEALKAYGRNPDANAESLLRAEIANPDKDVQAGAAQGFAALFGIVDALKHVYAKQEEVGFDGLTRQQQHYMAVFLCDAEVNNGGFSQYYVNSSAENWKAALSGYRAIGAAERAKLLRQTVDLFGPRGPSIRKRRRDEQRAAWPKEHDATLDALTDKYYKCKENIKALLAQYAAANHMHFHD